MVRGQQADEDLVDPCLQPLTEEAIAGTIVEEDRLTLQLGCLPAGERVNPQL
jgi:hypothetical protein